VSIKASIQSPDLQRQIDLLKFYPEVVEKHFRGMLKRNVSALYNLIKPMIPRQTGRAQSKFKKSVAGKGISLTGRVGWWGQGQPWYINVVEHGAEAHPIEPRERNGYLRLLNGEFVKRVDHPGFSKRGFIAAGYSALKPMIDADLKQAGDAVTAEMAVK
jgi:hypothetical protein